MTSNKRGSGGAGHCLLGVGVKHSVFVGVGVGVGLKQLIWPLLTDGVGVGVGVDPCDAVGVGVGKLVHEQFSHPKPSK